MEENKTEDIKMDLFFSLTFHTGTNEEINYSANLGLSSDVNSIKQKFISGWQTLEDQVFGKIEGFIKSEKT
jgi:hypothetical protein